MSNLRLIGYLCVRAITDKFSGMALGRAWGVLQPLLLILTYYIVFSLGLKVKGDSGINYTAWLISGLLPWIFFNEGLLAVTASLKNNGALLKRLSVPAASIHIASLAPAVVNHVILVLIYVAVSAIAWGGSLNGLMMLAAFLYVIALLFAIGVILSVFYVYVQDTIQVLQSILNVLFWVTPIVWPSNIVSTEYSWILTSNPIYFVVETYRRSLISGMPGFEFDTIPLVASVTLAAAICVTLYKDIKKVNDFV